MTSSLEGLSSESTSFPSVWSLIHNPCIEKMSGPNDHQQEILFESVRKNTIENLSQANNSI